MLCPCGEGEAFTDSSEITVCGRINIFCNQSKGFLTNSIKSPDRLFSVATSTAPDMWGVDRPLALESAVRRGQGFNTLYWTP